MSVSNHLINRLNTEAAQRLVARVRKGRRKALAAISQYCVVTTDDGRQTREVIFDQPPTIGQLVDRVGQDAWVVSVRMRRGGRRRVQTIAAE